MNWNELEFFHAGEFDYPEKMDEDFLRGLDFLRSRVGLPIYISSDYRPGDQGAHGQGLAVDITDDPNTDGITSHWCFLILYWALIHGFTRIGIYDKHIHLDRWTNGPQKVIWIGTST